MRRVKILFAATSILCCLPLFSNQLPDNAPVYQHEVQFKLGPAPTIPLAVGIYSISMSTDIPLGLIGFLVIPALSAEYLYNATPRHAIGASVNTFLILPTAMFKYRFTYKRTATVRLYGSVGLGFGLYLIYPYPAIQLTPFGVQFGGKKGFFTMETGIGMEGSFLILGGGFRF